MVITIQKIKKKMKINVQFFELSLYRKIIYGFYFM